MVVFIDESYKQDTTGQWHYALAGFGINEFRYRALQAAVYQLIRKYFDAKSNYVGEEWRNALTKKIFTEKSVNEQEVKAQLLLKSSHLKRFGGVNAPHYRLTLEILEAVQNAAEPVWEC